MHLSVKAATICCAFAMGLLASCGSNGSNTADAGTDTDIDTDTDADTDADTETGTDTDTDTDTDTEFSWFCPEVVTGEYDFCDYYNQPNRYFSAFTTDDTGEDIEFITTLGTPSLLLAERITGEETDPIVFVLDMENDTYDEPVNSFSEVGLLEPEAETPRPRGVIWANNCQLSLQGTGNICQVKVLDRVAVLMMCSTIGCTLYGLEGTHEVPTGLAPIPGGEVPVEDPVGIYWIAHQEPYNVEYDLVCVHGEGISCFDGTSWSLEIAPGTYPPIHAVDIWYDPIEETTNTLAAGAEGILLLNTGGGWEELDSGTDTDLTHVSWFDPHHISFLYIPDRDFVATGSGTAVLGSLESDPIACEVSGKPFSLASGQYVGTHADEFGTKWYREVSLYNENGTVITIMPQLCTTEDEPLGTPRSNIVWGTEYYRSALLTETGMFTRLDHWTPE